MAHARSRARSSNALMRKLAEGKGSIHGMELLLPIEWTALVPVEVMGISFGHSAQNGVAVTVRPVGGHGVVSVAATELLDTTPKAIELYEARGRAATYKDRHGLNDSASDRAWREAVTRERAAMSDGQRKRFDAMADKFFREGQNMIDGIKAASNYTLKDVFRRAIDVRFDIDDESSLREDDDD